MNSGLGRVVLVIWLMVGVLILTNSLLPSGAEIDPAIYKAAVDEVAAVLPVLVGVGGGLLATHLVAKFAVWYVKRRSAKVEVGR